MGCWEMVGKGKRVEVEGASEAEQAEMAFRGWHACWHRAVASRRTMLASARTSAAPEAAACHTDPRRCHCEVRAVAERTGCTGDHCHGSGRMSDSVD